MRPVNFKTIFHHRPERYERGLHKPVGQGHSTEEGREFALEIMEFMNRVIQITRKRPAA